MTEHASEILAIAAAWIAMVILVSRITTRSRYGSVGLPMAFMFSMTFLYCGFISYAMPGYSHLREEGSAYLQSYDFTEETVLIGARASVIGVAGFLVGCWWGSGRGVDNRYQLSKGLLTRSVRYRQRILWSIGLFGLAGFILNSVTVPIPMVQAILQVARNVAVVTVCLGATLAVHVNGRSSYIGWIVLAAMIPCAYLILWGFTSYGFIVFTCFAGFWLAVLRPRSVGSLRVGIGSIALTYALLSMFVAWMSFRTELRDVLWGGAGAAARIDAIVTAFSKTEILRPGNFESLDLLNIRLNQYIFVGKMIEWHALFPDLRLNGQSIFVAFLAWIPRFVWPGKPEMGGASFVAENTGMRLSEGTTFGAGPVFEFYVNFGIAGVFIGFVVLGLFMSWVDRSASSALWRGGLVDFSRWFAVGLAFIAPLTDFFFMINTAMISWLVISSFKLFLEPFNTGGAPNFRGGRQIRQ